MTSTNRDIDLHNFLKEKKEELVRKYYIRSIGIFRSHIKVKETLKSDIDILVEFKEGKETFRNYIGLKYYFEDTLKRKIDLVIKSTLNPLLREVVYA
ncbi:MAG: nucleotidyltransferase family protein [Candidatus Hodarchaeales archaeon]